MPRIAQITDDYLRLVPRKKVIHRLVAYFLYEGRQLTTRGRWINPFVRFFLTSLAKRKWSEGVKHVVICGTGRSGTTILGMILSVHPKIFFVNEPKLMWHAFNPLDDIHGNFGSGQGSLTEMTTGFNYDSIRNVISSIKFWDRRHTVFLDKYPELACKADLRFIKRIWIIRDPIEFIGSVKAWNSRHGTMEANWFGSGAKKLEPILEAGKRLNDPTITSLCQDVEEMSFDSQNVNSLGGIEMALALEWLVVNTYIRSNSHSSNTKIIEYNSLIQDLDENLEELFDFLDLEKFEADYSSLVSNYKKRSYKVGLTAELSSHLNEKYESWIKDSTRH